MQSLFVIPGAKSWTAVVSKLFIYLSLTVFAAMATPPLLAAANHPVSVIEADIYVTKFKTTMRLRCFAEDLELIHGVEALEDGFYDTEELFDATGDHAEYLAEKIELIDEKGILVPGQITEIDHFEVPEEGVRAGELMKYSIGIVIEYKHEQPPNFLTINQHVVAAALLLPSELKILLKQQGSELPYFKMMKPDQPETFSFDWTHPLPASDASDEERESWFEQQREKTLGITSYSSVYSFIYITNYQIRHEVLIPLATLASFFEIDRKDPGFLDIPEQDVVAEKIKALFSVGNPVSIDNVQVDPVFDRIDFYALDLKDFAMQAQRRRVSMANGRVGIIMSYGTKGIPRDVKLTWDIFNDTLKTVDSIVFAFEEVGKTEFSMFLEDNTYHWSDQDRPAPPQITNVCANAKLLEPPSLLLPLVACGYIAFAIFLLLISLFLRNSASSLRYSANSLTGLAALLLVGGWATWEIKTAVPDPFSTRKPISEDLAQGIFEQLHKNMFRAFDYHNESDIYDALARSVDGELLRQLYLEINDTLRVAEQGGAVSRIDEVKIVDGQLLPSSEQDSPGFDYRCRWELLGTVEHWGHIHERNNKYNASFRIELIDKDWKIRRMQMEDFEHGVVKTRLRQL